MRPYIFKLMDAARDEAARFSAWVKARGLAADDWITLSGRDSNGDKHGGARVLLDDSGAIVYGLGGGHEGKKLSEAFSEIRKKQDVRGQGSLFNFRADKRRDKKEDGGKLEREREALKERGKEQEARRAERARADFQKRIDENQQKREQEQQERKARVETERKKAEEKAANSQIRAEQERKREVARQFAQWKIPGLQKELSDLEKRLPELKQRADAAREYLRGKDKGELAIKGKLIDLERPIKNYEDAITSRSSYKAEIERLNNVLHEGKEADVPF